MTPPTPLEAAVQERAERRWQRFMAHVEQRRDRFEGRLALHRCNTEIGLVRVTGIWLAHRQMLATIESVPAPGLCRWSEPNGVLFASQESGLVVTDWEWICEPLAAHVCFHPALVRYVLERAAECAGQYSRDWSPEQAREIARAIEDWSSSSDAGPGDVS
jgi:hypothetical protein